MFSFPTDDRRNRALLRINDSNWSAVSIVPGLIGHLGD
jgi:hypothetical protein